MVGELDGLALEEEEVKACRSGLDKQKLQKQDVATLQKKKPRGWNSIP